LNNPISVTYTATGVQGKTTGTQTINTPTIIIHGTGHTAPTTKIEYFTTESQRVPSASYDDQSSLTNAVYNAATSLGTLTSELAFFDNALVYPSVVGNMSGAVYKAGTVPDYSGLTTGTKYLYRRFLHDAAQGATATKTITIPWTGMTSGFVINTTALTNQNAYIHIKIPATTGYRDLLAATPANTTAVQLNDNVGCGDGSGISSNTAKTINMGQQQWAASDTRWLVRITTTSAWTGRITQITVT
jgi:hypothetical protein